MKRILGFLMALMICLGVFTVVGGVNTVYAADIASGTYDGVSWKITEDGELILGNGGIQTMASSSRRVANNYPWSSYYTRITKVSINGTVKLNGACQELFYHWPSTSPYEQTVGFPNLTYADISGLDFSGATDIEAMFLGAKKLETIILPENWDLPNCVSFKYVFAGCSSLKNFEIKNINISKAIEMQFMFYGCENLTSINVSGFDTSRVINMTSMFNGCTNLVGVDVSNWNTSNVTDMSFMFQNCKKLKNLDVSKWNTSKVTTMRNMFISCYELPYLDVSNWNVSQVTHMGGMFNCCYVLKDLDVSKWNTSSLRSMDWIFNVCRSMTYIDVSNWNTANVTNMLCAFTNCSKLENLDLGKWNTSNVTNMGAMFHNCSALKELDLSSFDTHNVTNLYGTWTNGGGGIFQSCKNLEKLDVSGFDCSKMSNMKNTFTGCTNLKEVDLGSGWKFTGNGISSVENQAVLPTPSGDGYTGKWIRADKSFGPFEAAELRDGYTSAMAGTWVWEEKLTEYTVSFEAGENGTGAMAPVNATVGEDFTLPKNQFVNFGYDFDHWIEGTDGNKSYTDTIPANTYQAGDKITLTAVWKKRDTSLNWDGNEATFSIRGGEQAVLDGIPAGTSYQVYELTPNGWVLVRQENTSGVIDALKESAAAFWNKYQPGVTTAQFSGLKYLDGQPAKADAFEFELWEGDKLIETVSTLDGGFIQFGVIKYDNTMLGEHVYTIKEVNSGDDSIDYDTHEDVVVVDVVDNGDGILSNTVTYDDDGVVFSNATRPGNLRVTKDVTNGTSQNANDEFTLEIEFRNESGMPFGDDIYWYIEDTNTSED